MTEGTDGAHPAPAESKPACEYGGKLGSANDSAAMDENDSHEESDCTEFQDESGSVLTQIRAKLAPFLVQ